MKEIDIKIPQLAESVTQGTLLEWKYQVGDTVLRDAILVELETDKVVLEIVASEGGGILQTILAKNGETVYPQQVIAKMMLQEGGVMATNSHSQVPQTPQTPQIPEEAPRATKTQPAGSEGGFASSIPVAMPAAAKLLREHSLDPATIAGSGRGGRITKEDVRQILEVNIPPSSVRPEPPTKALEVSAPPIPTSHRPEQRVPMTRLRARIAERLLQSQANNAILTTFNEVNMAPIIQLRQKYQERFEKAHGVKLGFMSFFVKAAVYALKKFPILNASVEGADIIYHGYFDIGIAVGSARGLVVPIIRDADQLSFAEIEKKITLYGHKAQEGKLDLADLTGGTFSISNGGVFGSMLSTPIINPPQSAILGIHATKDRAVVENGQIVIRPINYLAMSYDHRIIDGREAVQGLVAMKDALEDPATLLFDL
ncbi:MAG: 2-oxoglutarate dehydrogenase complex dihydrolipoyllysine-residue succinyltransferase [Gammaproteobacteria bacterium]|nr:2-oxoglutarate dehydrogenase complex dihydrolipoyllysine-residue succinyltransferase [Gammaproteobacteria bacterium]